MCKVTTTKKLTARPAAPPAKPEMCECGFADRQLVLGEPICLFCLRYDADEPTHPAWEPSGIAPTHVLRHKLSEAMMAAERAADALLARKDAPASVRAFRETLRFFFDGELNDFIAQTGNKPVPLGD